MNIFMENTGDGGLFNEAPGMTAYSFTKKRLHHWLFPVKFKEF